MAAERFFVAAEEQLGQVQALSIGRGFDRPPQFDGSLAVPSKFPERVSESNPAVSVIRRAHQGLAKESLRALQLRSARIDPHADVIRSQLLNRCLHRR